MNKILEIKNLHKFFEKNEVLKGINLSINEGEIITFLGDSGCGKSTLLRCIAGFIGIEEGEIYINGNLCSNAKFTQSIRDRNVGILFQDYALFPHFNVRDNILFGIADLPFNKRMERLNEMLESVDIVELKDRYPHQLSGGQQQRVALARALAPSPNIILLDEPFSNLNHSLSIKMREELKDTIKRQGLTAIMVTHDRDDAFYISDRIALMNSGKILDMNEPIRLYQHPSSIECALFLGDVNYCTNEELDSIDNEDFRQILRDRQCRFRPRDLVYDADSKFSGTIIESIFFGDFIEVIINLYGIRVSMYSNDFELMKMKAGESIPLSLLPSFNE